MSDGIHPSTIGMNHEVQDLKEKVASLEKQLQLLMSTQENSKNSNSVVIVLDSCKELGEEIVKKLAKSICTTNTKFYRFGNNETNTFPCESVREKNVFIIGSGSNFTGSINDNIMTMCGMIRSCRDASANKITAICPYYPYCRSDKKDQARAPIMAELVSDFFKVAGANRVIAVDLHAAQIQGFFGGPFDNLYAINYLINQIKTDYPDHKEFIIVSPDAGGEKRVQAWANKMNLQCTFLTKYRDHNAISTITKHELVHQMDFTDKKVLLVDDIGDTFGTLNSAAKILKEKGAKEVIAVVTHGVFSGNAFKNLEDDNIDRVYTTNTIPQSDNCAKCKKIRVVDLSELFANAIDCCINAKSISKLFD